MKLQSLIVQNYGAFFGSHTFQLSDKGLCLVLGDNQDEPKMDSNGSGKSTIFDALDWCLFGVVPRGDHVDSIVNELAGRDCHVQVGLTDEAGVPIEVSRWRRMKTGVAQSPSVREANGVSLRVGGRDRTALDANETQKLIEQELGLDRDTFHASVLFGQLDLLRFADCTDAERMEALTRILQLGEVDEWLERAKLKAQAQRLQAADAGRIYEKANGILIGLQGTSYDVQIQQWEDAKVTRSQVLHRQLSDAEGRVGTLMLESKDVGAIQKALADHNLLRPVATEAMKSMEVEFQNFVRAEATERANMGSLARQAQALGNQILQLRSKANGTCSACGQVITGPHIENEVGRLQVQQSELAQQVTDAGARAQAAAEGRARLEQEVARAAQALQVAQQEHQQRYGQLQGELATAQRIVNELVLARGAVDRVRNEFQQLSTEQNPWFAKKQEQQRAIQQAQATVAEADAKRRAADEAVTYYDFWVEAFGPRGLKNYVLDTKLQAITDAANRWVHLLTGGTIWVRIETQTLGRSTGTLRNKLNIRVFRHMPDGKILERNYRSWSGGEKQRVSLGIDLGLSSLIAARSRKRYDLLILDELFKHLDPAGEEAVMELLHHLKREKSSVFVVSHSPDFQAQFERRITIQKVSGKSRIIEEVNRDYRAAQPPAPQPGPAAKDGDVPAVRHRPRRTPVAAR